MLSIQFLEINRFLLAFVILVAISKWYILLAEKYNIVDKPNHRSSHSETTIRGGGILFYIAIIYYFFYSGFHLPYFFLGISVVALVSFIDDINPLSPKLRFPVQVLAVILCLIDISPEWHFLILTVAILIGVAFINAFNFMDGINGITGFYASVVFISFLFFNTFYVSFIDGNILYFSLIAIGVFGYYNFRRKARFFAGDVGSITLAMVILYTSYLFIDATGSPVVFLLIGVYAVDSSMTIFRRIYKRENLTEPHRLHLYQRLTDRNYFPHLKISMYYSFLQICVSAGAFFIFSLDVLIQWVFTSIILILLSGLYFWILRITNPNN